MKNINRLLAAAAILLSAAACHTNEIDPIKPDPVNPGESGLTITANIVKTRVTYNDKDEDYLDQQWEEGDILFGYYGGDVDNKVILTVSGFDEAENAILIPAEDVDAATLKDLAKLEDDVPVDLVYIGANVSAAHYPFDTDGNLTIDMSPKDGVQDGVNIPACMHARAYVEIPDKHYPQNKSLFFKFENDCAIIEIYSLTGVKEEVSFDTELDSLSVSNLLLQGTYSLGDNGFTFAQTTGTSVADFSADLSETEWYVDSDGSIHNGNSENRYLIAVVPNDTQKQILVNTYINGDDEPHTFDYGEHDFDAGKCYVIHEADVVAKTVDGLYFTTVKAAFKRAAEIAEMLEKGTTKYGDQNVVTLVKDEIYGLVNHAGIGPIDETIVIDYPVTLDLNGCWLNLGDVNEDGEYDNKNISESFIVSADEKFTISDPNEGEDTGGICSDGNTADSIIENFGEVIIENGCIWQFDEERLPGTEMLIIDNQGSLSLFGGDLFNDSGPVIYSGDGSDTSVGDEDGTTGPSIYCGSEYIYAISVDSKEHDTTFKMTGGEVIGGYGGINLCGSNVTATISGGEISNSHDEGNAVYVQYGTCNISGENTTIKNGNTGTSSSDNSSALYLDNATATISGGATIDGSSRNHAIYCHNSSCEVSGAATKILGAFESAAVAAVDCIADEEDDKPSFIMLNGTVQTNSIAIHLGKNIKGTISNGTIKSTVNSAIVLSGSSLTIGGTGTPPEILTQSSGKPVLPAIKVEESEAIQSKLFINSGTITGVGVPYEAELKDEYGKTIKDKDGNPIMMTVVPAGAIELIGNVTCDIKGGSVSSTYGKTILVGKDSECNISGDGTSVSCTNGYAVFVEDGECTLSSGTIVSNSSQYPAVYCFRSTVGTSYDLTIKWQDGVESNGGPLIMSSAVTTTDGKSFGPVSTVNYPDTGADNCAKVEISGGYLYSNDDAFYSREGVSQLVRPEGTYFYSNKRFYYDFTMAEDNLVSVPSEEGTDITDPVLGKLTFDYKITSVSEEPSTDPDPIVLYEGSSTNQVTISYNSFVDADPKPEDILRVSFSLTDPNANLENESLKIYDAWSGNTIEFNLASSVTVGSNQYYCENILESEWISSVLTGSLDLTLLLGWGGVITKVELIQ